MPQRALCWWQIPQSINANQCFIQIADSDKEGVEAENDEPFSIYIGQVQKSIEVIYPNAEKRSTSGTLWRLYGHRAASAR